MLCGTAWLATLAFRLVAHAPGSGGTDWHYCFVTGPKSCLSMTRMDRHAWTSTGLHTYTRCLSKISVCHPFLFCLLCQMLYWVLSGLCIASVHSDPGENWHRGRCHVLSVRFYLTLNGRSRSSVVNGSTSAAWEPLSDSWARTLACKSSALCLDWIVEISC